MGASRAIYAFYLKFSTQRNFIAEFHRENVSLLVKQRISVSEPGEPPFFWGGEELRGNVCDSSLAR